MRQIFNLVVRLVSKQLRVLQSEYGVSGRRVHIEAVQPIKPEPHSITAHGF